MPNPYFFGEGSSPRVHDTRWRILQKILAATNGAAGGGGGGGLNQGNLMRGHGPPAGVLPGVAEDGYVDLDSGVVYYKNDDGSWPSF